MATYADLTSTYEKNLKHISASIAFAQRARRMFVAAHGWPEAQCAWGEVAPRMPSDRLHCANQFRADVDGRVECEFVLSIATEDGRTQSDPLRVSTLVFTNKGVTSAIFETISPGALVAENMSDAELQAKLVEFFDPVLRGHFGRCFG